MSKINRSRRASIIKARKHRKQKIAVLSARLAKAKGEEKHKIEAKIRALSPEYFNQKKK